MRTFPNRESKPLVRTYTWDTLDRMQKLTYPMRYGTSDVVRREMTLTYDIASRIDSLKYDDAQSGQVFASNPVYNAASQVETLTIGSPTVGSRLTESYDYDSKTGLLTSQKVTRISDGADFVDLKYNYTLTNDPQNNGAKTGQLTNITDVQNQNRNRAFEYDKLGRLKRVKGGVNAFYSPQWAQIYTYDRYGNRSSVVSDPTLPPLPPNIPLDGLASLSFNTANNRVTSTDFVYDPAGNQTKAVINSSGTAQQYRYDAAGRLAQVLDGGGANVLATYSYGASNQRLVSVEGAITTFYGWDGGQVIAEYAPSGATDLSFQTGYVYLGGRLLATVSATPGSGTRFHHPDRLGTKVVTDQSNGELVTRQMGMPYGTQQPIGPSGGDNTWQHSTKNNPSKKRFTSYDRSDATGLDYAVNRHYSSAQGRFTQVDPIGMSAASLSDPQSLNLYSYCGNDPVNYVDPEGLFFGKLFRWIGKIFKVVAIAVFVAGAILLTAGLAVAAIAGSWAAGGAFFSAFSTLMAGVGAFLGGYPTSMIFSLAGASASASAWAGLAVNWTFVGVGAVGSFAAQKRKRKSEGRAVPLSGKLLATFNAARDAATKILDNPDSDCAKFLRKHGIDPKRVSHGLKNRTPYDGMASTNIDSFGVIEDRVNKVFKTWGPDAANNNSHTRIYYAPSGLTTTTLIHEEIHPIMPPYTSDKAIYEQLGGTAGEYDRSGIGSKIVNKKLEENGCK